MPLQPNDTIGAYRIERELGRGGMGVVFLGRDTRLDRAVAIKALPDHLAHDPDRLARFEREARALAQLSHANVAGIYGVEEHQGAKYLILEYVEGETLADRLDRGSLPIDEALDLAGQIAAGVEEAHEVGVIHRDLKPGNVIVTPDGKAKVLDFGLARVSDSASTTGANTQSPTLTTPAIHSPTMPGVIMGTAAYMSPEQARGRSVDKRTDIWSFGVMLYEMLAGANPFVGETVSDSIGAVLHKEVDLSRLPAQTPPAVRRIIRRCVERDKSLRYRDIGDVRVELRLAHEDPADGAAAPPAPRSGAARWAAILAVGAVCAAGGWIAALATTHSSPSRVEKYDVVVAPEGSPLGDASPMISPDGARVAYIQDGRILVRDLSTFESRTLATTEQAVDLFWSPDGKWIGFHTRRSVFKIALTGGDAIKVSSENLTLGSVSGGGWTKDDHIVIAEDPDGIMQVSARGGAPTVFLAADQKASVDYHDVTVVPGTNTVLYIDHQRDQTFTIRAYDGKRDVLIVSMADTVLSHPSYSPSGHVLFSRGAFDRNIWAIEFDAAKMEASGDPFLVEAGCWQPSVAADGTLAVIRGSVSARGTLAWASRAGDVEAINGEFTAIWAPILSPDGTRVAFSAGDPPKFDIWVRDLERGTNSRLTFVEGLTAPFGWSPDSREVAVSEFMMQDDTSTPTRFLFADGTGESRPSLSSMMLAIDGTWTHVVLTDSMNTAKPDLHALRLDDGQQIPLALKSERGPRSLSLSHDGTLLAYVSDESGETQIYCTRFPDIAGKWQVSTAGGFAPQWSADDTSLYFVGADEESLFEVSVNQDSGLRFGLPALVIDGKAQGLALAQGWSVASDGQRVVTISGGEETSEERSSIAIIRNWFEAFRSR